MSDRPAPRWRAARVATPVAWALALAALLGCPAPAERSVPTAEEVRVPVGTAQEVLLAGTLVHARTTPGTRARAPVVLLLSGSGPQDRDGARADLPGYRPWRQLAASLADRGIASLRLDDRGTGGSSGLFAGATTDDFAADARAALAWLRARAARDGRLDASRVAVVGHSEGALVALLVAQQEPMVRALVLLGAPARPGREVARWQRQAVVVRDLAAFPPASRARVLARADAEAERTAAHDPWLRHWFDRDPRAAARTLRRPVLLVHGETDQQVPVAQAHELADALRAGGSTVRLTLVPRTNHLLLTDALGDPAGYVRLIDRRVPPAVLEGVASYLAGVFGGRFAR